ncbi:MAG: DNA translocase FtsK [Candidatus Omnitrophota bacterium]
MKSSAASLKSSDYIISSVCIGLSAIIFLSLFTYNSKDISFLTQPPAQYNHNLIGVVGAYVSFLLRFLFGRASYFLPFCLFFIGLDRIRLLRFHGLGKNAIVKIFSCLFFVVFLCALLGILFEKKNVGWEYADGAIGFYLAAFFKKYLGIPGAIITIAIFLMVNGLLLFGFFFADVFHAARFGAVAIFMWLRERREKASLSAQEQEQTKKAPLLEKLKKLKPAELRKEELINHPKPAIKPEIKFYNPKANAVQQSKAVSPTDKDKEEIKKQVEALDGSGGKKFDPQNYKLPSIQLLKVPPLLDYREVKEDIEASIKNLEDTLTDFDVEAKVVSVQKGPVVTMYELQPAAGVKIQKISALADDIAMAMKSSSVRIVAPIPGRGTVGVEVPNEKKHLVYLREVLEDKVFTEATSKLTLAIGKDVSGNPIVADLKDMPHLLIAGTTGSGKTVCVNTIISSIMFKAKPDEVKFILIDPKMVELAPFAGIPYLLHPIIYEAKKAFIALNWAVEEMERRYKLLAQESTRNIDAYNKLGKKMPFIIIVVDELADLMVVARESIEVAIQRLAQLSRAVGIHLILATQRPSVDVITGVIKANFPARISFKVSAKVDSRTVLDAMGADKLIGKGDLLFLKPGAPKLIRAQGSYIEDEDIDSLTKFIRNQGGPIYETGIVEGEKRAAMNVQSDELLDDAVKTILQARQASASILQRRLRVGYTRAARLLDLMEQQGIVGPFCGSKAREILVDPEEFFKEKEKV